MEKITSEEFTQILEEHTIEEVHEEETIKIAPENKMIVEPGKPSLFMAYIDNTWLTWEVVE